MTSQSKQFTMTTALTTKTRTAVVINTTVQVSIERFKHVIAKPSILLRKKLIPMVLQIFPLLKDNPVKICLCRLTRKKERAAILPFSDMPKT